MEILKLLVVLSTVMAGNLFAQTIDLQDLYHGDNKSNSPLNNTQFITTSFEAFEVLSTFSFPVEDLTAEVYKDDNGNLATRYELIGKSLEAVQLGMFADNNINLSKVGGTTCSGRISCGRAIKECLDSGRPALITIGPCVSAGQEYCVTCQ
ncbi:MAG: hypothetical protein L3J53_05005 [Proteobacteria bacterium]|nr:hypothetical protein [Pseudomonadota bacterium]